MTSDVLDQLEENFGASSLGSEISDELVAILRGDPDAKKDWSRVKLSDVAEVVGGSTPSTKELEYWDGDIPWLTPKDLSNNNDKYVSQGERYITELGLKNSGAKLLPKNSILFSSRAPIGYVAIASGDIATNQGFKSLVCDPRKLDYQYAYYLMLQLKGPLEKVASGSTFLEVSGNVVKNFEIDLPPLHIQKQIADLLSVFDEKIELLRAQNKTLESIAQAIYKRWFVDFEFPMSEEDAKALGKPELTGQPYKSSGGQMKPSELGDIPERFSVGSFSSLIDSLIPGEWGKEAPEGGSTERVICLRGTDLQDIKYSAKFRAPIRYVKGTKLSSCQVFAGDLVVEVSGGTEGQSTGRIAYINEDFEGRIGGNLVVSNFCKLIRPKETSRYPFIYHAWQHLYNKGIFFNFENGTTGIKNLNLKAFTETPLISINQDLIADFSVLAALQLTRIQKNLATMNSNVRIRDFLAKKLI